MSPATNTVQIATLVPAQIATALKVRADANERSVAAEARLALKTWVEAQQPDDDAQAA